MTSAGSRAGAAAQLFRSDFKHVADCFIQKTEELLPTLQEAFEQTVPTVIDCPVDYRENMKLSAQLRDLQM